MADLEANFMHLQLLHESLTRFSESFASFLYGLNMNAFCVDFPEVRGIRLRYNSVNVNQVLCRLLSLIRTGERNRVRLRERKVYFVLYVLFLGFEIVHANSIPRS